MHRLTATDTPMVRYTRTIFPSYAAVEVEPMKNFFNAEEYHQKYLDKNPGAYCHIPASKFKKGL